MLSPLCIAMDVPNIILAKQYTGYQYYIKIGVKNEANKNLSKMK